LIAACPKLKFETSLVHGIKYQKQANLFFPNLPLLNINVELPTHHDQIQQKLVECSLLSKLFKVDPLWRCSNGF